MVSLADGDGQTIQAGTLIKKLIIYSVGVSYDYTFVHVHRILQHISTLSL
jgi:hypothetical protein